MGILALKEIDQITSDGGFSHSWRASNPEHLLVCTQIVGIRQPVSEFSIMRKPLQCVFSSLPSYCVTLGFDRPVRRHQPTEEAFVLLLSLTDAVLLAYRIPT